jgi:hypothetical protein
MLEDLLDAADKPTAKQLQIAVDASGSNNAGIASNGARDALAAGDHVAALGKLAAAHSLPPSWRCGRSRRSM